MTRTKKMICIALALLMIAGAVFFAIYNKVGKKFDYGKIKDYSKYITIDDSVIGLTFDADDSKIEKPGKADVYAQIGKNLRATMTAADKKTGAEDVIGAYDAVYVNYYGTYVDDNGVTRTFTSGSRMDKDEPIEFFVESGADSEEFANSLKGKSPNPDGYKLKETGTGEEDAKIAADDVVYITYSWVRYPYEIQLDEEGNPVLDGEGNKIRAKDDEGNDKVISSGDERIAKSSDADYKDRSTTQIRVDLADVQDYFPAGFADQIVGKAAGSLTFSFDVTEGDDEYRYDYTVSVVRVIETFDYIDVPYTYPADSTVTDLDGKEMKGKDVVFHVVIAYFNDAPDLTATTVMEKLNFASTDYYKTKKVQAEDHEENGLRSWQEENENKGKTHEDYEKYLVRHYVKMVEEQLNDQYDVKRLKAAAKPMWEELQKQATIVSYPKKAIKVTKSDLLSGFKKIFNTNQNASGVSYRTEYGSFKKFMEACYADETVIKGLGLDTNSAYLKAVADKESYDDCIAAAAEEIVANKLLIYALSDRFGSAVRVRSSELDNLRLQQTYFYYYVGYPLLPDSALRECIMFDNVMKYVYDHANVQWASAAEPAENP